MSELSETLKSPYGVGFRSPHFEQVILEQPRDADIFEIVSDNFMAVSGRPRFYLERLRENYPVMMHGVGLSIGSKRPIDKQYLRELKHLVSWLGPTMVSDHLSWGHFDEYNSHDLLPIVYTKESLAELAEKLDMIQDFLGHRFYLENPSAYVSFRAGDYSEHEFLTELLDRTGAGLLLDINNLYVNHRNLGRNPRDLLGSLRADHIGYFHLAGHSDQGDVLVDTHDSPVSDAVWELFAIAKAYFPGKPAIIEWDGKIPSLDRLLKEAVTARNLPAKIDNLAVQLSPKVERIEVADERAVHQQFFSELVRPYGITQQGLMHLDSRLPTPAEVGLKVYNHAFFSRLEDVLNENFPALAFVLGKKGFRHLVADYLSVMPPVGSGLEAVGRGLLGYLQAGDTRLRFDFGVPNSALSDLALLEWAQCEVSTALDDDLVDAASLADFSGDDWERRRFVLPSHVKVVQTAWDVLPVLKAVGSGDRPLKPDLRDACYLVYREGFSMTEREISGEEALFGLRLKVPSTFMDLAQAVSSDPGVLDGALLGSIAERLVSWSQLGLIKEGRREA